MAGRGERLPGAPIEEDLERVILHVDVDCFYAACERLRDPELEGEPLVVGMGYEPGDSIGAVATASYEAREYGVESAQAISQALERLPRRADNPDDPDAGHYRPVDIEYYREVAAEVKAILHDLADTVREVSIDEAYLDVTDRTAWEVAAGFGRHVKERIEREVGVTASVGVAPNMSTAKIASDHDKPDGLTVVPPGEVREFLAPLPVEDLHGIGPVTAGALRERGIETAADLAGADPEALGDRFGDRGRELHARARGDDDREVTPVGRPKSLSRESAFAEATADPEEVGHRVRVLAAAVAERARGKDALYRTIGIKVVTPPYDVSTRERSLPGPVDDPALVEDVALDLLAEFDGDAVRKVGVRVSNLSFAAADQSSLDGWEGVESESEAGTEGRDSGERRGPRDDSGDTGQRRDNSGGISPRRGGSAVAGSRRSEPELTDFDTDDEAGSQVLDESVAAGSTVDESSMGGGQAARSGTTADDSQVSLAEAARDAPTRDGAGGEGDTGRRRSRRRGQTTIYDFI